MFSSKKIKEILPVFLIFIGSVFFTYIMHLAGAFGYLEMKLYDFRFSLRGAVSGTLLYEQKTKSPLPEFFIDMNDNGLYDQTEPFRDNNNNNKYDEGEEYTDINNNGKHDTSPDIFNLEGEGCWEVETCENGQWDDAEEFIDQGNNMWDDAEPFVDRNSNGVWDDAEPFRDDNQDGVWNPSEPIIDKNANGKWDDAESYQDINENGYWDPPEIFNDENENGRWDEGEKFEDVGNGIYDFGEDFIDVDECYKTGTLCHNQKCVEHVECHDINQNGVWDDGLNVVIVEIDDESYEYLNEPTPYSRSVWARAVRNLTDAGAKVVTIDIEFDKPDHQIENLKNFLSLGDLNKINFVDGDSDLGDAIRYAKTKGTQVILASKVAYDKDRNPSTYRVVPHPRIITSSITPYTAQVDIAKDADGIQRLYPIYNKVSLADTNYYYSLAVSSVLRFKDIETDPIPSFDHDNNIITVDSISIPVYGKQQYFLINYYGPNSQSFSTFKKYPLVNILDTKDYMIGSDDLAYCYDTDWEEPAPDYKNKIECEKQEFHKWTTSYDSDWMEQFIDKDYFNFLPFKVANPFEGKIVYIGTSLAEDHDFKDTPFLNYEGGKFPMPGVEVHANATQQLLDNNFISYPIGKLTNDTEYRFLHFFIILAITLITLLIVVRLEPFSGFLFVISSLFIWLSYSIGIFFDDYLWIVKMFYNSISSSPWAVNIPDYNKSSIIPVIFPAASILVPYGINLSYKLIVESNSKRFLKDSFGAYISPDLIDQMFDEKKEPKLGGDPGYHTMMFSDIASFSTFSEKLEAESLLNLLNEYLTAMTNILINNKGTLDKYIGDAIVAFYGAPIEIEDHEYLACKTAIEMNKKLDELRVKWKSEGQKWPQIVHNMQHRIGINAGKIVVGNMGSEMKLNYTMTGDQVNLTARLESSAKQLGISVQVGENIYDKVKDRFVFRDLGKVVVVGRNQSLNVYELISILGEEDDNTKKLLEVFHEGLKFYHAQEWDKAISCFKKSEKYEEEIEGRKTNPSKVFIERSQKLKIAPPGDDWDGSYILDSK